MAHNLKPADFVRFHRTFRRGAARGAVVRQKAALRGVAAEYGLKMVTLQDARVSTGATDNDGSAWFHSATARLFADLGSFPLSISVHAGESDIVTWPADLGLETETHLAQYSALTPETPNGSYQLVSSALILTGEEEMIPELVEFLNAPITDLPSFFDRYGLGWQGVQRIMTCIEHYNKQGYNADKKIIYIGDLIRFSERELLKIRNFGHKSFNLIKDLLKTISDDTIKVGNPLLSWRRPG